MPKNKKQFDWSAHEFEIEKTKGKIVAGNPCLLAAVATSAIEDSFAQKGRGGERRENSGKWSHYLDSLS